MPHPHHKGGAWILLGFFRRSPSTTRAVPDLRLGSTHQRKVPSVNFMGGRERERKRERERGALCFWVFRSGKHSHSIALSTMASSRSLLRLLRKKPLYHSADVTSLPAALDYVKCAQSAGSKSVRGLAVFGAGVCGILSLGTVAYADEVEHGLARPSYPWPHKDVLSSYDQSLIRREEKLFRSDCASCHGGLFAYGHAGEAARARKETADMIAEIEVVRGSDDKEVLTCPRKANNYIPGQFTVEQLAKFGVGAGCPSDLNLITKIRQRVLYNPYFSSGMMAKLKMPNVGSMDLNDEAPQNVIQMGKDVVAFSSWVVA